MKQNKYSVWLVERKNLGGTTYSWIGPRIEESKIDELLNKYKEVYHHMPGVMKKYTTHLSVKPGVQPVFLRAHCAPFAL